MVLDGNVAPTLWTNNNDPHATLTVLQRVGQDVATADTLDAFLTLCGDATTKDCAFSAGTPARTHAKFTALLARLRKGPVTITLGGSKVTFTYASLLTNLVPVLQITRPFVNTQIPSASLPGWPQFAAALQALWAARGGQRPPCRPCPLWAARPFPVTPEPSRTWRSNVKAPAPAPGNSPPWPRAKPAGQAPSARWLCGQTSRARPGRPTLPAATTDPGTGPPPRRAGPGAVRPQPGTPARRCARRRPGRSPGPCAAAAGWSPPCRPYG